MVAGLKDQDESGAAVEAMKALAALREPGDRELVEQAANRPSRGQRDEALALLSRWGAGY